MLLRPRTLSKYTHQMEKRWLTLIKCSSVCGYFCWTISVLFGMFRQWMKTTRNGEKRKMKLKWSEENCVCVCMQKKKKKKNNKSPIHNSRCCCCCCCWWPMNQPTELVVDEPAMLVHCVCVWAYVCICVSVWYFCSAAAGCWNCKLTHARAVRPSVQPSRRRGRNNHTIKKKKNKNVAILAKKLQLWCSWDCSKITTSAAAEKSKQCVGGNWEKIKTNNNHGQCKITQDMPMCVCVCVCVCVCSENECSLGKWCLTQK